MAKDVFDLMVRVLNRLEEIRTADLHPAYEHAFTHGVLHGLRVGQFRLEFGYGNEEDLLTLMTTSGVRMDRIFERINQNISESKSSRPEMLEPSGYRTSDSKDMYFEGVLLGYNYVFELFEALDRRTKLTADRVRETRNAIASL